MVTWEMKSDLGTDKRRFISMTSFFSIMAGSIWVKTDIEAYIYVRQSNSNSYIRVKGGASFR